MRRSREHAKQIAAQLSEQSPAPFVDFQAFPVTSPPTPAASKSNTVSVDRAYNMNVIDNAFVKQKKRQSQPVSLDAFVEQQQQHVSSSRSVTSESHFSKRDRTVNSMPTFPSNSTMQSRNAASFSTASVGGGAARRRMARAQKQQSIASRSDAVIDYDALDDASANSPYPLVKSGSSKANHLLNYAQTPRAPIDKTPTSNRSLNSLSLNSQDAFGFSFDAFGLDETQVDMEVHEALESLAQGSRPDVGIFLGDDEFPMQTFDSSRGSTPTSEMDGFTDGFRLVNVKQSPTSSDRSSLTSGTNEHSQQHAAGINRFKLQAGFHKSTSAKGRPPFSPSVLPSPPGQYARSEPGGGANYAKSSTVTTPRPFPAIPKFTTEQFPEPEFPDPEPSIIMDEDESDSDYGPRSSASNHATSEVGGYRAQSLTFGAQSEVGAYRTPSSTTRTQSEVGAYRTPSSTTRAQSEVGAYRTPSSSTRAQSEVGAYRTQPPTVGAYRAQSPTFGAPSDTGARSDVAVSSDVGIRSDVGVNSDVGAKSDVAIASDVGVASNGGANSDIGQVPTDIMGKLRSKKTAEQRAEEKEAQRVKDLKQAWERRHQEEADEAAERLKRRQSARSPLPQSEIVRLQNKLGDELLSPEILERKQVRGTTVSMLKSVKNSSTPERAAECTEQRTSFASYRDRLKPAHTRNDNGKKDFGSAKSDIGGYGRPPSEMNAVLNRFNKQKSFGDSPRESYGESRSDVGSKPAFLAKVKLRSTGNSPKNEERRIQNEPQFEDRQSTFEAGPSQYDDEFGASNEFDDESDYDDEDYGDEGSCYSDDDLEWAREHEFGDDFGDDSSNEPKPPRKMTYRERRELELKAERERKAAEEKAKKEPERDVAALIRKRIAANKKAAAQAENEKSESTENISDLRNRLRKVPADDSESPRQPQSAGKKFLASSPGQPPSAAQKLLQSSPEFSVKQLKKAPVADKPQAQPTTTVKRSDLAVETNQDWPGSGESTSPNMHPPSMVASEVDSSSTIRTYEELSSSLNQKRQPITEVPAERAIQSESIRHEPVNVEEEQEQHAPQHVEPERVEPQYVEKVTERSQPAATGEVEEESISVSSKSAKSALTALLGKRLAPPALAAPEPMLPSPHPEPRPPSPHPEPMLPSPHSEPMLPSPHLEPMLPSPHSESMLSSPHPEPMLPSPHPEPMLPSPHPEPELNPVSEKEDVSSALMKMHFQQDARRLEEETPPPKDASGNRPALKDDPKYARYFRMLKVGMPMDVVKHAMMRDDMDPSVMDGDHNKPAGGVPLKEDPKFARYFKMLAMGLPMGAVKNAMVRDGLDPAIMDGDHNLPAGAGLAGNGEEREEENKPKDTHRRTRLHWETLRQVRASSLWAKIGNDPELEDIDIDEEEFAELFQAELTPSQTTKSLAGSVGKRKGAAVRVIESKRANNGGIILARLKMTHDEMADAVDRM